VRFWDASAVVPIVIAEPTSAVLRDVADEDPVVALWWGTSVEALSALCRKARDGELDSDGLDGARDRLWAFLEDSHVIAPGDQLRDRAHRLLAVHALRAADALQLPRGSNSSAWTTDSARQPVVRASVSCRETGETRR